MTRRLPPLLVRLALCTSLRPYSSVRASVLQIQTLPTPLHPYSRAHYATETFQPTEEGEKKREKQKVRRAYALGGCLLVMWLSTHALLLYKRRNEHHALNKVLPPISFEDFVVQFLATGKVKTISFQPSFGVANVYLHDAKEVAMKNTVAQMFSATPDKFTRLPDVRFTFEGDVDDLEKSILAAQKAFTDEGVQPTPVEIEVDQFPSYRELAFIVASTLFTLGAVTLIK